MCHQTLFRVRTLSKLKPFFDMFDVFYLNFNEGVCEENAII